MYQILLAVRNCRDKDPAAGTEKMNAKCRRFRDD